MNFTDADLTPEEPLNEIIWRSDEGTGRADAAAAPKRLRPASSSGRKARGATWIVECRRRA